MQKWKWMMRLLLVFCLVGVTGAAGMLGWKWLNELPYKRIDIAGARHAPPDTLVALARVDTTQALFSIDPILVEDRIERHPWVRTARVRRLPTGTLDVRVEERRPAVLVLGADGVPSHYLDPEGYPLPLAPGAVYDVPLLRGLSEPYHPLRRVQHAPVPALLGALTAVDDETDALISEVEVRASGDVWLYTTPVSERGSVPVRLGHGLYLKKLNLLRAFWDQAVLPRQETAFSQIDLRFDGQIVTRESISD